MPDVTKESFGRALGALVRKYERDRETYLSPEYNEAQTRTQFISPLLEALGWDLRNEAGVPYHLCEVWEEKGETHGRPDYTFRVNGHTKFFLEAKSPSDQLSSADILQTKRYAWNAARGDVFFAGVCDFEQFRFFDASLVPNEKSPLDGEAFHLIYKEYESEVDTLWELSRERVAAGSLDQFLKKDRKSLRQRVPLDETFLNSLTEWRHKLASAIYARNHQLDAHELNDIVQRLLDRLIFIRIAEDRKVMEQRQLWEVMDYWEQSGGRRNIMDFLVDLFREVNENFNGEIFKEHPCERIAVDSVVLARIIRELYPPKSNYVFNIVPVELLGSIYERYLGNTLTVTAKQVHIQPKPEVRKAGGVYYTPQYIVDYIVKNTVGTLVEGKPLNEVEKIRILDPACGSGSFLLGAFQYLIDYYIRFLTENPKEARTGGLFPDIVHDESGKPRLSVVRKTEILRNNLYGVDIDLQAVDVTMMSLYLKAIEGERSVLPTRHQLLPPLKGNIRCGNSLVGPDIEEDKQLRPEERQRINPFDWNSREDGFGDIMRSGGFDIVVGNPPYDVMEKDRGASSWPHAALSEYVRVNKDYEAALGGKLNLFRFFVVRSLELLKSEGRLGMIVPLALLADITCSRTRQHLIPSTTELLADCFPQKDNPKRRVFLSAKLSTVVLTGSKAATKSATPRIHVRTYPWNSFDDPRRECTVQLADTKILDPENTPIPLADAKSWDLCLKIHTRPRVKRLAELKEITVARGEINQTTYRKYITVNSDDARLVKGVEVGRYEIHDRLQQGHREWLHEKTFLKRKGSKKRKGIEAVTNARRIATQRITGVDERLRVVATIIDPPAYFADSTNSIKIASDDSYQLEYVLALLNSHLFQWRFKLTSTNNNVGTNELDSLPFRKIDFSNDAERAKHENIVTLVKRILELNKSRKAKAVKLRPALLEAAEKQIAEADARIENAVYGLYGITEAERAIIEGQA